MPRKPGSVNVAPLPVEGFMFEEVAVPTVTRTTTAAPNPFLAVVAPRAAAFLAGDPVKALSFSVPNDRTEQTLRLLGLAGRENGVTVRKSLTVGDTDTKITFWCSALQTRPRKA